MAETMMNVAHAYDEHATLTEALTAISKSYEEFGFIKVSERVPEEDLLYDLLVIAEGRIHLALYITIVGEEEPLWFDSICESDIEGVTHWMKISKAIHWAPDDSYIHAEA